MVIFTIYHFWQDISDFWNTGGTFAEGMTSKCPSNIFTDPTDFGYMWGPWITAESTAHNVTAIYFDSSNDGSGIAAYEDPIYIKMAKFDKNGNNVPGSGRYVNKSVADPTGNPPKFPFNTENKNHDEIKKYYDESVKLNHPKGSSTGAANKYFFKKGSKFCSNPSPSATSVPSADAGSGNIELNQPLTNNYDVGTNVQATSMGPRNNVVTTTDDKGNTITTTTQESSRVDANTGAQIQEKCITVSQLHSASEWVDHLFQTLGGTKCADKDKVATAKNASKMDFIAGVIKGYQRDTAGSHESYMTAINKAGPYLDQAFSGDNVQGTSNNLAQSTTEQISNNSSDTPAPVTNDIQAPQQPTWQAGQMAQQFSQQQPQMINGQVLPNGFIVEKGNGQCPNGCKYPQYDNRTCEDTVFNGKQYRKCPWVKDGLNGGDCASCGAILMPKNEHGYARTAPGLFDNVSLDMALKTTDTKGGDGDYYNIGKNFMTQLSKIKNFNLPNTIEPKEYISIGKLIHKYQTERTELSKNTLTKFINDILVTVSLSKDRKINDNSMITAHVAKSGGNFDIKRKKLTGKGVYAYEDAEREMASNNRLGGAKTLYEKQISAQMRKDNGIPRDPRKNPTPYNSIWNVFNY